MNSTPNVCLPFKDYDRAWYNYLKKVYLSNYILNLDRRVICTVRDAYPPNFLVLSGFVKVLDLTDAYTSDAEVNELKLN